MGKFKEMAENLYLVVWLDNLGNRHETEQFGGTRGEVEEVCNGLGLRVLSIIKLEGAGSDV